jgi:hypothetical protein
MKMAADNLTCRRKADRMKMADAIQALWESHTGFTCERSDPAPCSPRGIWLQLRSPRGACVTVEFDGDSTQPDTYVLSWHLEFDCDERFSASFANGSRNRFHKRKATDVVDGFGALAGVVEQRIANLISGEAYE